MKYTHYGNFGVQRRPYVADHDGYIPYREDVVARLKQGTPTPAATEGERWIAEQELWFSLHLLRTR